MSFINFISKQTGNQLKRITTIIAFLVVLFCSILFAQNKTSNKIPSLYEDSPKTFKEIQSKMEDYRDSRSLKKGGIVDEDGEDGGAPGWSLYKRWEYYWEQRVNLKTGAFPTTSSVDEYEKYKSTHNNLNKVNYNESWSNLGTNSSLGGYAGIGRINCIAFHPTDPNTFWVGSPSGGIWKTTVGGNSWTILNNSETVLGVSAIVVDYTDPDIIYIATGDRDRGSMATLSGGQFADNVSIGVLKSIDGGVTWNTTGLSYSTSEGKLITSLLMHPSDHTILFAAMWDGNPSTSGIFKSTDAGATWTQKTNNLWIDIEFKPGDPTIMYASSYGFGSTYINRSTDSGENWVIDETVPGGRRGEIAVTPADPTVVYLISANPSGGVLGVYKSTDSGVSFLVVNPGSPAGMLGYYTDGSGGSGGQGSYDWCIAVDPSDADIVFIGGVTTWKSIDGGSTFTAINNWTTSTTYNMPPQVAVVHADKHVLAYQNSSTLFEGNDGGIYKTTNVGTTWNDLTNGMVISQIYRIGVSQTNTTTVLTGLQDNGSKLYNGFWSDVTGGDGMECIVDYSNSNYMYATYVQGQIQRSINGSTFQNGYITANIPGGQPLGAWVTPYIIDPNNSATLFVGYDRIWKTTDRGNTSSWATASQVLSSSTKLRSLAIAPSNSDILYTADQTNMWKTTDGGATNWTSITLPSLSNSITYIAVKDNDPNTVWFTVGGYTLGEKVYESTDGGANWNSISTGLPNLPIMSIVYYKVATDRNVLFVGTDVGVYVKDGLNDWVSFSNGLPNVVVSELEVLYTGGTNKLRAGTFGRGLWETDIDAALPVELSSFNGKYENGTIQLKWTTQTEVNNYGFDIERKTSTQNNESWEKIAFVSGNGNSNTPKHYSFNDEDISSGTISYRLKQIDNNGQFKYSTVVSVFTGTIPDKYALEQNYPNPFNPSTNIRYSVPRTGNVKISVFNIIGEEVAILVDEIKKAGSYTIKFDASEFNSGMYIYRLESGSFTESHKMLLIK